MAAKRPETFLVQQDEMFPDAAAGINEWTFQRFDTAFFNVVMRGAGTQHLAGGSAEGWDFRKSRSAL